MKYAVNISNTSAPKLLFIPKEWKQWIEGNLERGCTVDSMVPDMVRGNFDEKFAREAILHIQSKVPVQITPTETGSEYQYGQPIFKHAGNFIETSDRKVKIAMRLKKPEVVVLEDLLSTQECDEMIRLSLGKLERSSIVDPLTGKSRVIDQRSSSGAFFARGESDFIKTIEARLAAVMCTPVDNGEGLQILNYQVGGEYRPHFDFFPPHEAGSAEHLARGGQRVSTLVVYLNDVQDGGETSFPDVGLSVVPKKGSGVYFEYCNAGGQLDKLTLHAGEPVRMGEKWIMTKWVRLGIFGEKTPV